MNERTTPVRPKPAEPQPVQPVAARRRGAAKPRKRAAYGSLTEQAFAKLSADIRSCRLKPGSEVSEAELSDRMKMSKTPIREALTRLSIAGFVRSIPRRGYAIAPLTVQDFSELVDIRTMVEIGIVGAVVERITERELDELERLAHSSYDPHVVTTLDDFIAANRAFHLAIAKATGNLRLQKITLGEFDELERYFYVGAQAHDINLETNADHLAIVQVLRRRDVEGARRIIVAHNERTRRNVIDALTSPLARMR